MKIIGNTVGTTTPKPNLMQTDPKKGDFVKGKDILPTKLSQLENDSGYAKSFIVHAYENDIDPLEYWADETSEEIYEAKTAGQDIICDYNMSGIPVVLHLVTSMPNVAVFSNSVIITEEHKPINRYVCLVINGSTVNCYYSELATEDFVREAIAEAGGGEGGVYFETDKTLTLKDGILSVNTTNQMEKDNTLPITSAGVYATVGNIEVLLKTI